MNHEKRPCPKDPADAGAAPFTLRRRWARRLAKGQVPLIPVLTSRGSVLCWTRGQMRLMKIALNPA